MLLVLKTLFTPLELTRLTDYDCGRLMICMPGLNIPANSAEYCARIPSAYVSSALSAGVFCTAAIAAGGLILHCGGVTGQLRCQGTPSVPWEM